MDKLPEGAWVTWDPIAIGSTTHNSGTIVGIASTPMAILGSFYIVKLKDPIPGWPYSCIVLPECSLVTL